MPLLLLPHRLAPGRSSQPAPGRALVVVQRGQSIRGRDYRCDPDEQDDHRSDAHFPVQRTATFPPHVPPGLHETPPRRLQPAESLHATITCTP